MYETSEHPDVDYMNSASDEERGVDMVSDDDLFAEQGLSVPDVHKKPYEVDFTCFSLASLEHTQRVQVEHIAGMFVIPPSDAAVLLRHFHWDKERLIEKYMDTPELVKQAAGVAAEGTSATLVPLTDFTCEVCFLSSDDHDGVLETVALSCGHRFCRPCYTRYVEQKVRDEGESARIQCMDEKCQLVVDEDTMAKLLPPPHLARYRLLLDRAYVDDHDTLRWCPAPDCEMAVECHISPRQLEKVVPTVKCGCGHWFCFGCGLAAHQPVICSIVKLWLKKSEDDSETSNWISANTKECPKCSSTIEKSGGCNHMTCRKCRYEFCWMCSGPWSEHGNNWYHCNRYDEKAGFEARDSQAKSRASLERYLHYFNRFANHEQSARLDRELYRKIEKKMEEMQANSDLSWIEVQFLKKAADTLTECRMTLKWTYCMVYYLERNNMTELFEDNQR